MAKGRLTLSIEEDLIKKIKIIAIKEDTNVTAIVEGLIADFIKSIEE